LSQASTSNFLRAMAESSQARYEAARAQLDDDQLRHRLSDVAAPLPLQLQAAGFDLIAEVKRRSPAEGELSDQQLSPVDQANAYIAGGAVAISVLTEPERFSGSLDDLSAIAAAAGNVPVMRKDFLVNTYQIREARLAGASGVLLIAAILSAEQLAEMLATALELRMFVLLEVFDAADIEKALPVLANAGPAFSEGRCQLLLGVNCRDLKDLQVNFSNFETMAELLPDSMPWVAESGLQSTEQAGLLACWGYRLALAGTTLMRSDNPQQSVRELTAAGRAACL
jgi:indole-3-glycerol phosphate synthase